MSYVTNGAALPPISHREYARRLREALGERDPHLAQTVFRPVPSRLFYLPVNGLLIAVGILMVTHQVGGLVGKLLAVFLIGNAFASLGFLGHEVLHNAVVRRRWIRDLVGGLCFSPVWLGPRLWRIWHNEMHHNHTQHPDDDPDTSATYARYQQSQALRLLHRLATRRKVVFLAMLAVWFPFHAHRMLLKVGRAAAPRLRLILLLQWLVPCMAWNSILPLFGPSIYLWCYLLPFLVGGFIVMAYIATNHLLNPQLEDRDELQGSLSVQVPRLFALWHLDFGDHVPHHVFPAMSHKWGRLIRELMRDLWPERYHEMSIWQALKLLLATPRIYLDHDHLFEPITQVKIPTLGRGLVPDRL